MNLTYPVGTIGSVTFLLAATLHQELDRVHCSKASILNHYLSPDNYSNTMGATSGTGTTYPSGEPEFIPKF
jgi:hypothetical protein